MTRRHGFTLVELLVVVSIIALLVALLLPSLGKARAVSVKLTCLTKIRALAIASNYYGNDNQDVTPCGMYTSGYGVKLFTAQLFPKYLSVQVSGGNSGGDVRLSFFRCPVIHATPPTSLMDGYKWPLGPSNYFGNVYALGTSGDGTFNSFFRTRIRYSQFTRASGILMYADNADSAGDGPVSWEARVVPSSIPPIDGVGQNFRPFEMSRHLARANVVYVDGHGGELTAQQLIDNPRDLWAQVSR